MQYVIVRRTKGRDGLRRLNVLHIVTKLELGGAQKSALDIVSILNKTRYNLSLVSSNDGILLPDALNIPEINTAFLPALKRTISPLKDLRTLISLTRFIKNKNFDIVHTHSSKAGILGRWAARLAGVPVILHTIHGWGFHQWQNPLARRLFIFLERLTARITDKLIAVSQSVIKKGLNARIGTEDKYALLEYGIPLQKFTGCQADIKKKKEELGLKTDSNVVGMVACFKPQKAPEDFIKVAALVKKNFPETKFLLVGDGVLRRKLEGLRKRFALEKDVIFTGWRRDIPQILSILDVFMLTSLWEGSPIVLLEAMASAVPIVATSTGGAQEIIRNGINGFLVSPGNIQTMAQRAAALLKNKALARKMGREGKRLLGPSFEVEHMVERIDKLYQTLGKEKRLC
ncbi:glycosyltransferase family 4 protein [Patescibacteria group bacterium]|nr:glycosyltransferase family 4 protein [Patescibacteria group bacterium]